MKRIPFLLSIAFLSTIVLSSCNDSETYADQLKIEKETIAAYIKREKINVLKTFPTKFEEWGDNNYYLSESGLYFHLVDSGDVGSTVELELNDLVVPRYKEYTLTLPSDTTTYNWNTQDYPFPASFNYGNTTQSCEAFHEAAKYMKRNNSQAKIIVPSKIGFYASDLKAATPYGYELKIKIQK